MAFILGNDHLIWVAATSGGTYYLPAGQQSGRLSFKLNTYDAATKDSGGYAVKGVGLKDVELTCDIQPNLPDANGWGTIQSAINANPSTLLYVKVRKAGTAATDADTIFAAPFYVSSADIDMAQNDNVKTPLQWVLGGTPTVALALA